MKLYYKTCQNELEDPNDNYKFKVHVNLKATTIIDILVIDDHGSTLKFICPIEQFNFAKDSQKIHNLVF